MHMKGSSLTSRLSSVVPGKSTNSGSTPGHRRHENQATSCTTGLSFPKASRTELKGQELTDSRNGQRNSSNTHVALYQERKLLQDGWEDWGNGRLDPGMEKRTVRLSTLASKGSAQLSTRCVCERGGGRRWKREGGGA